jgi:hypothetical protein
LIKVETNITIAGTLPDSQYCGLTYEHAASKCEPCETNQDCNGRDLCHADVLNTGCVIAEEVVNTTYLEDGNGTNATINGIGDEAGNFTEAEDDNATLVANETNVAIVGDAFAVDTGPAVVAMSASASSTTNYCGASWGDAANNCISACPSGTDAECSPGHFCFSDVTTCSSENLVESRNMNNGAVATSNYCGVDWSDANSRCSSTCPEGTDAECPFGHRCFGDIHC